MNTHPVPTIILAAGLLAIAFGVSAADNAGSSTTSNAAEPNPATSAPAKPANATPMHHSHMVHHSAMHHGAMHGSAMHSNEMAEYSAGHAETAYRMALRQCVEGPLAQRDTCLDTAISHYGRG